MQDDSQVAFWNEKAETFPRYEEGDHNYEAGVLDTIRASGVDFRGKTVLDVGCGSGMYTLRIAREASRVTALDISERMLAILEEDAAGLGIDNIEYVHSTWDDFDSPATFDIVFCSMTPAIRSEESKRKLLRHAHGWIVFMGFAGIMSSDMLNGLYAKYGIEPKIHDGGPAMRRWLDEKGVSYAHHPVEGQWVQTRGKEETVEACATMLRRHGTDPDPEFMEQYIRPFEQEPGKYVEHTDYKIDLLVWKTED